MEFLSPDVFVREISTGGRAIQGVGTATAAFLGLTERGPIGEPILITSFEQYIDTFGTFTDFSFITDAVWGFFLNGGRAAWVTRTAQYTDVTTATLDAVANARATETLTDRSAGAGTNTLKIDALNEGEWANNLKVSIIQATSQLNSFNRVFGNDGGVFTNNSNSAKSVGVHKSFTEENSIFTDRTAALRTPGGGTPFSLPSAIGDALYVASKEKRFSKMFFDLNVSGVAGTGTWEYFDGDQFRALTPTSDATDSFKAAPDDNLLVEITAPSDWQRSKVNGEDGFWLRYVINTTYTTPADISRLTYGEDRPLGVFTDVADPSLEVAAATAIGDTAYFGSNTRFGFIESLLATAGDGTGVIIWEFWDGSNWSALSNITETASDAQHFQASGTIGFDIPINWFKRDVNGFTFFWARARITTNYTAIFPTAEHLIPSSDLFRVLVQLTEPNGNARLEDFDDVTMDSTKANYVETRVGTDEFPLSRLITVTDLSSTAIIPNNRPRLQTNTPLSGGVYDVTGINDADFIGSSAGSTGLFSYDKIDEVNILCVPGINSEAVNIAMLNYAEGRADLITIIDSIGDTQGVLPQDLVEFARDEAAFNSSYGSYYDYWIKVADPITGETKTIPYSGFVAGMYARTDFNRGVWKSPAGIEDGLLRGALGVVRQTAKGDRDFLYVNRINPIRDVGGIGVHVDGGKTLAVPGNDFDRIAIRRLFLFLEESIQEGLQFAKHEPSNPRTWGRIRATVNAFLVAVWQEEGLFGDQPNDAFFVICDETNNDPITRRNFIIRVRIGAAPNFPGEFLDVTFEVDQRAINEQLASFNLR